MSHNLSPAEAQSTCCFLLIKEEMAFCSISFALIGEQIRRIAAMHHIHSATHNMPLLQLHTLQHGNESNPLYSCVNVLKNLPHSVAVEYAGSAANLPP